MKKDWKKKLLAGLLVATTVLSLGGVTTASAESYTYTIKDEVVPAPDAYTWERSVRAQDLGIENMSSLTDTFCKDGKIYILMNSRLVVTDEDFNTLQVITEYKKNGETVPIKAPKCVFVTDNGDIYLTEQDQGEIIHLDAKGNLVRVLGDPQITTLDGITYAPTKVVVDDIGRIYVKAKSVYEGIIELDPDGIFNRFIGANNVVPSMIDRFYRMIATEEQISRMALWLPTDYSDIALDAEGYILATIRDLTATDPIRKLNSAGKDVLAEYEYIASPKGDYATAKGATLSNLTNIAAAEDGRFAVLDANMSRVFVYAPDGILLYVLAGSGKQNGQLNSPIDVAFLGEDIIVADSVTNSIEVFKPTEYGALVNEALRIQKLYDYEGAAAYWQQVYEINPNSVAANMGLGKYQLRTEQYDAALQSFQRTGERQSYSAAFERVREVWLENNLGTCIILAIIVVIALVALKIVLKKMSEKGAFEGKKWVKVLKDIKYTCIDWPLYMLSSPFKAFDDIKYENAGSTKFSFVIMILFAWAALIKERYTGFLMNTADIENLNIPLILISSVVPYILFIFANWAIGVLIDGKGNLRNVFKFTAYSLYPSVWLTIIGVLGSRICIYEETGLVNIFFGAGIVFAFFYMFIGIIMIHQFTFTKGVGDVVLSLVAMVILIFVIVLLATLVSGFINDVGTIIDEILIYL